MYRCFAKAQTFLFMIKWCRWVIKSFAIAEYWFGQNIDSDERLFFCSIVSITSLKFYHIFSWYFNFLLVHYLPQNCYILTIVLSLCLWLYLILKYFKAKIISVKKLIQFSTCYVLCIGFMSLWNVLSIRCRGPASELLGGSKVNSAFHPFEIHQMSTRNSWQLKGKNWTVTM